MKYGKLILILQACYGYFLWVSEASILRFEPGHDYHYTYAATSNIFGLKNISTIIKLRVRHINSTSDSTLNRLYVDSFFQRTDEGHVSENPLNWTLTHPFLFKNNKNGLIHVVYYDEREEHELITLKKAITSVFSAHVEFQAGSVWSYIVNETDHGGEKEHHYFAERHHDNSIHLKRFHNSITDIERHHQQIMEISSQHEIQGVTGSDKVLLKDKLPTSQTRKPLTSEYVIEDKSDRDFPDIESSSSLIVKLEHKTRHDENFHMHYGLKQDIIVAKMPPKKRVAIANVKAEIDASLSCIRGFTNKYATNRTECVATLKNTLELLEDQDLVILATRYLNQSCLQGDTVCQDERFLFIDMLSQLGTAEAQTMIVKYVFNVTDLNKEEIRRSLFHFIALKEPITEVLNAVWTLCFGINDENHGTHNVSAKDTHRACLTLGALGKTLAEKDPKTSKKIVRKLTSWLGYHDGSKPSRVKRSLSEQNKTEEHYRVSKMVLIHALGNTGHDDALNHIVSYLQGNAGHSSWRRASVSALRWFKCRKSAESLLEASLNDVHHMVREMSFKMYKDHPQSKNMTEEEENMVLAHRYTYPTVVRVKRGGLADLLAKLSFKLEIPGVDWSKTVGTSAIGAAFGLIIRNRMELELKPLSGFFEIDVHNEAYATGLLGIVGLRFDIFRVLACYEGHIRYDLNVLKDFGINDISDLAKVFDKIVDTIRVPIVRAIERFKAVINLLKGKGLKGILEDLINIVRNFPNKLKLLVDRVIEFSKEVADYEGLPWVRNIKRVYNRVKYFVEDVKSDVMNFYNSIVDTITVTLPYAARQIIDAIKLIVDGVKKLFKNPLQAISGVAKAILKIRLSLSMVVGAKQKIVESCFFLSGKLPYWMNFGTEFTEVWEDVMAAMSEVINFIQRLSKYDYSKSVDLRVGTGDGLVTVEQQELLIAKRFLEMIKETLSPIEELKAIAQPFLDAYNSIFDVIRGIKKAYFDLKTMVKKGRALIDKVFGPKFHKLFPVVRVDCDDSNCACGIFPSTVDGELQAGVDVKAATGKRVVAPVTGLVEARGSNEVLITPSAGAFEQYQIILTNVQPDSSKKVYTAGQTIGRVSRSKCTPNFIHVVMRKVPPQDEPVNSDDEYDYIDPTPFIDPILPTPRWITECNERSFYYIGQSADVGTAVDKVKNIIERVKREAAEHLESSAFSDDPPVDLTYRPPGLDTSSTNTFKESFKTEVAKFKDFTQVFNLSSKAPNILDAININGMQLRQIIRILTVGGQTEKKASLESLVAELAEFLRDEPIQHPTSFSPRRLRYLLQRRGQDDTGPFQKMVMSFLEIPSSVCPDIRSGIARGFGHFCNPHDDCLGVTCGLLIKFMFFQKVMKLDVRFNSCAQRIDVLVGDLTTFFSLNTAEYNIEKAVGGFENMNLLMTFKVTTGQQDEVIVSANAKLCSSFFPSCTQTMDIFDEMIFKKPSTPCLIGSANDGTSDRVFSMKLQYFANEVLDNNLGNRQEILTLLNELRSATLDALIDNPELFLEILGKEFSDKADVCPSGNIPIPPVDVIFFKYELWFFIGPIPLRLQLGAGGSVGLHITVSACFLSMTANVGVVPWVGGKVYGSLSVDIGFAAAGITLTGYLLETQFPITGTIKFNKFPLDIGVKMDLILVPLRLELKAWLKIRFFFFSKRWSYTLWSYTAPSIRRNIFDIPIVEDDKSAPVTLPTSYNNGKGKRSISEGCKVIQVENRDYTDPAFLLEVTAQDEVSDIKRRYIIGSHPGGSDIQDWTEMGGASITVPQIIVGGIPLFFTVKVRNSQGLDGTAECSLDTYDVTLPDGRVEDSYKFSSHPRKLSATLVLREDSPLRKKQNKAVGFGAGQFGNEVVDWMEFSPDEISVNAEAQNELEHFSVPRRGRLTSEPIKVTQSFTTLHCAQECVNFGTKCISFDYDSSSMECFLQSNIQGPYAELQHSGAFHNYERIGVGHTDFLEYSHVNVTHGTTYFINVEIINTLGYVNYLSSKGTLVDFTPPEPGIIANASLDIVKPDGCSAAVTQRCIDVTWHPNHRTIIDGPGSRTVFNGHEKLVDQKYTLDNHYMTAHWDGFYDNETDIWGYTWAAGSQICGTDVDPYDDPHSHLAGKSFWTHHGLAKSLHLRDGYYYVAVQALNSVHFGGSLVTTVCHSSHLIVDTTKPIIHAVDDYFYDEDFDLLLLNYEVSDALSGIMRVDFGLGHTKHDVGVRAYSRYEHKTGNDTYIVVDGVGLVDGVPAWIRLRAVNNVELLTAGHSTYPIMIDRTPPTVGIVYDGLKIHTDTAYQSSNSTLCAHWKDFFDPDSGISKFYVGFGIEPGSQSLGIMDISHLRKYACIETSLQHNTTYYATVTAINRGLHPKNVNASSNGVLVDVTPPETGWIKDGLDPTEDLQYTHKLSEVAAHYGGFYDTESGIKNFDISVFINSEHKETFPNGVKHTFEKHSFSLKNGDKVNVKVTATNGAGAAVSNMTNGYVVDDTPPFLKYLIDSRNGMRYQTRSDKIDTSWEFGDEESGVAEYRLVIFQSHEGHKTRFWPRNDADEIIKPEANDAGVNISRDLLLINGAKYTVQVTAVNHAQLSTTHESEGIAIDTTPPVMTKVLVGLSADEEELDDNGNVLHIDRQNILASWLGHDDQSDVTEYLVAVGKFPNDTSLTLGYVSFGTEKHGHIMELDLNVTDETGDLYYITVKVINGAGVESRTMSSRPIHILRDNVPGVIFDGSKKYEDNNIQKDISSLKMSFYGFESQICGIVGYQWAIGSRPGFSDVQGFSTYGIVMENATHGIAQSNIHLKNDASYFASVKAITGHKCHEDSIVSSSDGVLVDNAPPTVQITKIGVHEGSNIPSTIPLYQGIFDSIDYKWNAFDAESGLKDVTWQYGTLPGQDDIYRKTSSLEGAIPAGILSLSNSLTAFLTVEATDLVSNRFSVVSPPLTIDTTPPVIKDFECSKYTSVLQPNIECSWNVEETESYLTSMKIGLGTNEGADNLVRYRLISLSKIKWSFQLLDLSQYNLTTSFFVTLNVTNYLSRFTWRSVSVVIDNSPPSIGRIDVVTASDGPVICQLSQDYIELRISDFVDEDSQIDRYEVTVGTYPGGDDAIGTQNIGGVATHTLSNLVLPIAVPLYVSVMAFNKVGLSSTATSKPFVASPHPKLLVNDGSNAEDVQYQTSLSTITAYWKINGGCGLQTVKWAVYRIDGVIIREFGDALLTNNVLIDDELTLENGRQYFVVVKILDVLNRVFRARTNGVQVSIESPLPGSVSDGLNKDITYQQSTTTLSAHWQGFGDILSDNPGQQIVKYDVGVGNDRRFQSLLDNVHSFVNVGLNTTYTFTGLNLTAKTVRYFISVRAYSAASSSVEESSNGVFVGYREFIVPGNIQVPKSQSNTESLQVSWSEFDSDLPIRRYDVGISSSLPNNTALCEDSHISEAYDIVAMKHVGLDSIVKFSNLTMMHGKKYYVTVRAIDEAENCVLATSKPVTIDTTAPVYGQIHVGIETEDAAYVKDSNTILVEWLGFSDNESGIDKYQVSFFEQTSCPERQFNEALLQLIQPPIQVKNDSRIQLQNLNLKTVSPYYVKITATNGAQESVISWSLPIFLDGTPPVRGKVKYGLDWTRSLLFQTSLTTIDAVIAIGHRNVADSCEMQTRISFTNTGTLSSAINLMSSTPFRSGESFYKVENILLDVHNGILHMAAKLDEDLVNLELSGFRYNTTIYEGNYTITIQGVNGNEMVTTFAITEEYELPPFVYDFRLPNVTDTSGNKAFQVANLTRDLEEDSNTTVLNSSSTTYSPTTTGRADMDISYNGSLNTASFTYTQPAFGLHILGFGIGLNSTWFCSLWGVTDENKLKLEWMQLDFNPTVFKTEFKFVLESDETTGRLTWNLKLFVAEKERAILFGVRKPVDAVIQTLVWNRNNYIPPATDPFNPYTSQAVVENLLVALPRNMPCHFGTPFYDQESKIKEVWFGLGDMNNGESNIVPMTLVAKPCAICIAECDFTCDPTCQPEDFQLLPLKLENITLFAGAEEYVQNVSISSQETSDTYFQASTYYLLTKVVNYAGEATTVIADGITVDVTPPTCDVIQCLDPEYSMSEPVTFTGSSRSLGAYWECTEDASQISYYTISIGDQSGLGNIYNWTLVSKNVDRHSLSNIYPPLRHDTKYYFNVNATNAAGLSTVVSCDITADFFPPVLNDAFIIKPKDSHNDPQLSDDVFITDSSSSAGVTWGGGPDTAEFYEWQIGTADGKNDVFPKSIVGVTNTTSAEIADGQLILGQGRENRSLSLMDKKNFTADEVDVIKQNTYFNMEPGRCLHQKMYAVNRAHKATQIPMKTTCVKREQDSIIDMRNGQQNEVILPENMDSESVTIQLKGDNGVLVGKFSRSDLSVQYGSAASSSFSSYVENPENIAHSDKPVSRRLVGRYKNYTGTSFFITPAGHTTSLSEPMNITTTFNPADFKEGEIPVVLYYNADAQMWLEACESCGVCDTDTAAHLNWDRHTVTVQICYTRDPPTGRTAREVSYTIHPTQYSVVSVSESIINMPPVLLDKIIYVDEDAEIDKVLTYEDQENDQVEISISKLSSHGSVKIVAPNMISYKPNNDFSGRDSIQISMTEYNLPIGFQPNKVFDDIVIDVKPMNDPPRLLFLANDQRTYVIHHANPNEHLDIKIEGKGTGGTFGRVIVQDVDLYDRFSVQVKDSSNMNVNISSKQEKVKINKDATVHNDGGTTMIFTVDIDFPQNYYGATETSIVARDMQNWFSPALDFTVYILANPCIHGSCIGNDQDPECTSTNRSKGFNGYNCTCDFGYTGTLCETEINECDPNPCMLMYKCVDLVGSYQCALELPLVGGISGSVAAVFLILIMIIGICIKRRRKKVFEEDPCDQQQTLYDYSNPTFIGSCDQLSNRPSKERKHNTHLPHEDDLNHFTLHRGDRFITAWHPKHNINTDVEPAPDYLQDTSAEPLPDYPGSSYCPHVSYVNPNYGTEILEPVTDY